MKKEISELDEWIKIVAPSHDLRQWFNHDTKKWVQFKERYWDELSENEKAMNVVKSVCKSQEILTLLFASKDKSYNKAVALKVFLEKEIM